jgi:hypothetical protein
MKSNCFINLFDIYGKELRLNLAREERVKTPVGAFLGLVSILLICAICTYLTFDIFKHEVKSVIYN